MKNDNGNAWIIVAAGFLILALIFAACITSTASSNAEQESEEEEVKIEEIHDIPTPSVEQVVQPVLDLKETKGQEAQLRVPPLSYSSGVGYSNGGKLTYYPSRATYHYLTPTGSLGAEHKGLQYYMEGNEGYTTENGQQVLHQDGCFVISINRDYHMMNQVIQFDFGPCVVRDSGCAMGTVDMYVY